MSGYAVGHERREAMEQPGRWHRADDAYQEGRPVAPLGRQIIEYEMAVDEIGLQTQAAEEAEGGVEPAGSTSKHAVQHENGCNGERNV